MSDSLDRQSGCFGFFARVLRSLLPGLFERGDGGGDARWPFAKKGWLMSRAEYSFYRVLQQASDGRWVVCPKVGLGDLLYVEKGTEGRQGWRNKIDRKHIDFVLCDATTMAVVAAVELDDASHQGQRAQARDAVKDKACADAGLVLLRFPARRAYNVNEVRARLAGLADARPE